MSKILTAVAVSLGATLLPLSAATGAAPTAGFKVIVNASNPVATLTSDEVSQMFMKRITQWRSGGPVVPVDLPSASTVRDSFSRKIHGRSTAAIETHWSRQIFSGAGVPPLTLSSDREVMAYVRQNAGAIGYVSVDAGVVEGIKILDVISR